MTLTNVQKVNLQKHNGLLLLKLVDKKQRPFYAYLEAEYDNVKKLLTHRLPINLEDINQLGKVIDTGWGVPPKSAEFFIN